MTPSRPQPASPPNPPRPAIRRIQAVINPASGSVGPGAADAVSEMVAAHGYDLTLTMLEPDDVVEAVKRAVDAAPDLVLVLAGDGTARLAASHCGPDGPLVAPMAGGTLNMLPHAIYGRRTWREALPLTLETGVERTVSGGRIGGRDFYVAAILGSPALWAPAREAARAGDLRKVWRRAREAMRRMFAREVRYALDGARRLRDAKAMALITPMASGAMQDETGLETVAFGVASAGDLARLAFHGVVGNWRDDPAVVTHVSLAGRIESRHSIPAVLDGEIERLPAHVTFEFLPKAFRALAPPTVEESTPLVEEAAA